MLQNSWLQVVTNFEISAAITFFEIFNFFYSSLMVIGASFCLTKIKMVIMKA